MQERSVPIISVVMPAYNAGKYIGEAIDSILNQTFDNFEFIIINDGSTDGTKDIVLSYDDKRIVYLENEKNSGICITLNKGLDAARGKYIARMDSDDIAMSNRFEVQVAYLEKNPEIVICGTDIEVFGDGIKSYIYETITEPNQCSAGLIFNPCFAHPTVMWRADVMNRYHLRYDNACRGFEDFRLWWDFAPIGRLTNIPQPLLRYRKHAGQETKKRNQNVYLASNDFRVHRFEMFGLTLSVTEVMVIHAYSYGEYHKIGLNEFQILLLLLSKVCKTNKAHFPIKTTKTALKITCAKAIAYTIIRSSELRKNKFRHLSVAFFKGVIPFVWYLKFLLASCK